MRSESRTFTTKTLNQLNTVRDELWISLTLALAYLPFMNERVLRTAGDDKVYVAQALEMFRDGRFFQQTLFYQPNYFKGPLHYLFLIFGTNLFGFHMIATVYMNFLFLLAGTLALYKLICISLTNASEFANPLPYIDSSVKQTGRLVSICFAFGLGLYSHAFASQMEVELAGIFSVILLLSFKMTHKSAVKEKYLLWLTIAIAGMIKSPLHSVLFGVGAVIYYLVTCLFGKSLAKSIFSKFKSNFSWHFIAAAIIGIIIGISAYLPAAISDFKNFTDFFIFREMIDKPSNGEPVLSPILPLFSLYVIPFLGMFWAGILATKTSFIKQILIYFSSSKLGSLLRLKSTESDDVQFHLVFLSLAMGLPLVCFFIYHPYRAQNYDLPIMASMFAMSAPGIKQLLESPNEWARNFLESSFRFTFLLLSLVTGILTYVAYRLNVSEAWWPSWLVTALLISTFFSLLVTFYVRPVAGKRISAFLILPSFLVYGGLVSVLGERELFDLRAVLSNINSQSETNHIPKPTLYYYNLQRNNWSEWAYLNYSISNPVVSVEDPAKLEAMLREGAIVLSPQEPFTSDLREFIRSRGLMDQYIEKPWRRWRTRGWSDSKESLYLQAIEKRDVSILERNFGIFVYKKYLQ